MIEVFLLGVVVAYTRLIALVHVEVGGAVVALGALMLAMLGGRRRCSTTRRSGSGSMAATPCTGTCRRRPVRRAR